MPTPYGTILSSTPDSITRLVVQDGGIVLQLFTGAQEVTLTLPEVTVLLQALAREPSLQQDSTLRALLPGQTTRHWPVLGMACACEAQPSMHVADTRCSPFLREPGVTNMPGPQEEREILDYAQRAKEVRDGQAR